MSDALQRTVRRGIALMLLPLCGLVLGFERYLWADVYGASPPTAWEFVLFAVVPALLAVAAGGYLVLSGLYAVGQWLDPDPEAPDDAA